MQHTWQIHTYIKKSNAMLSSKLNSWTITIKILIIYIWPLVLCYSSECSLEVFCLDFEIPLEPTNTPILNLTFGYCQAGNNRPILDSLETARYKTVSLRSSCAVSETESSWARRFHRDNIPFPGGHSQFTQPHPQPCWSGRSFQSLSPSLLFNSLMFYLKGLVECLRGSCWRRVGLRGAVTKQWCSFGKPVDSEDQ